VASSSAAAVAIRPGSWGLRAAATAVAAIFAAPFVFLLVRNLEELGVAWDALSSSLALSSLARSVVLAIAVSLSTTIVGTAAAWLVTRTDLPGRGLLRVLLPLPLVIPSFVGAFVLVAAFAPGGLLEAALEPLGVDRLPAIKGFGGSFVVLTLLSYPYVYLPVSARLRQLPASLEESARLLGMGPGRAFFAVVLPQARTAVLAGTLLVFLYTISDFGVVQLMRYPALTRVIYSTRLFDSPTSLALSLQLGILALAVVAAERAVAGGPRLADATRGTRPLRIHLGRWKAASLGFMAALVGMALAAPVGVLMWWAVRGVVGGSGRAGAILGDLGDLLGPAVNTSLAGVVAAATAIAVVLPVAFLTARQRSRVGGIANAVIVAGFALPGLALALALVFWTLGLPRLFGSVYQTLPLLILAYVIHFGAHSLRAAQVAVGGLPRHVDEAARTLGAGRFRRLVSIEIPLMLPGLLAGAGLVLLSVMKELPATLLLAPTGFNTLATRIWTATESAFFADASLAALLLIALSGVLTWLLVIRRAESLV
jgi:iron(III) transport system permease protein